MIIKRFFKIQNIFRGGQGDENFARYRYFGTAGQSCTAAGLWELSVICIRYFSKSCDILIFCIRYWKNKIKTANAQLCCIEGPSKCFKRLKIQKKRTQLSVFCMYFFKNCCILYFVKKFTFGKTEIPKYRASAHFMLKAWQHDIYQSISLTVESIAKKLGHFDET